MFVRLFAAVLGSDDCAFEGDPSSSRVTVTYLPVVELTAFGSLFHSNRSGARLGG
jgi:hypothetical protein